MDLLARYDNVIMPNMHDNEIDVAALLLECGRGSMSTFRVGISWPLVQPGGLNQEGPSLVFQLGRPL